MAILGDTGSYAYACTRVRAKKPFLMRKDTYAKLVLMDTDHISSFIGESQYRKQINDLATRYSGIDLVEAATLANLSETYEQILRFSRGNLRDMISKYLWKMDAWNLKTILRAKFSGIPEDELIPELVPVGALKKDVLYALARSDTIEAIIEGLKKTEYYGPLKRIIKHGDAVKTLLPLENEIDKVYYASLLKNVRPTSQPNRLLLNFIKEEIDIENLTTLLKLKHDELKRGMKYEKPLEFFVPGGRHIGEKEFKRLYDVDSFHQFVEGIKNYPFHEELTEAILDIGEHASLNNALRACEKYIMKKADSFSKIYPLSILPIIHYIIAKEIEVQNIRIIARGKEAGLSEDLIKELIIM